MARWIKILFVVSVVLLILSYPAWEQKVHTEMAKYPAEFVAAHEFDLIFVRWVLPGIWLFSSGALLALVSFVVGIIQQKKRNPDRRSFAFGEQTKGQTQRLMRVLTRLDPNYRFRSRKRRTSTIGAK